MDAIKSFPNPLERSWNARIPISNNSISIVLSAMPDLLHKAFLRADTITWSKYVSTMTPYVIPINWVGHQSSIFNILSTRTHGISVIYLSWWFVYYVSRWHDALICAGCAHFVLNQLISFCSSLINTLLSPLLHSAPRLCTQSGPTHW